ncbi:hypothetical protein N9159_00895 [bacterium]|jgi:hypothetical protein|nr:hypothetical protein [bacterium]|tara:strand:+ start:47 stop:298 length:252 start_codon:yes stop_codon:yes gene_type:complete
MKKTLITTITSMTSLTELNEVIALCNEVKKMNAKTGLVVGQNVYVVQKTKRTLGVLEKIKISRATVRLPQGSYSVPLTMLEAA